MPVLLLLRVAEAESFGGDEILGGHVGDFPGRHLALGEEAQILLRHLAEAGSVADVVFLRDDDLPASAQSFSEFDLLFQKPIHQTTHVLAALARGTG